MPDVEWIPLMAASDVPVGKTVRVQVPNGRYCIVCRDNNRYYVVDCSCPHGGGPLTGADVCDGCVVCAVHYWKWNLQTGLCSERASALRLRSYPCELRDGVVWAQLSAVGSADGSARSSDLDVHF